MGEAAYREMAAVMQDRNIYAEVVSGMLPAGVSIVGENVSAQALHHALDRSFETARALGAELIIFDCPDARRLPPDFDPAMAWRQLGNLVRILQSYAVNFNIRTALLPLRRGAADLMNYVSEATLISAILRLDRIGVAASSYNMAMEAESLSSLKRTGSLLWHMRVSNAIGCRLPKAGDRPPRSAPCKPSLGEIKAPARFYTRPCRRPSARPCARSACLHRPEHFALLCRRFQRRYRAACRCRSC